MKLLSIFGKKKKTQKRKDAYQDVLDQFGKDQFKKLAEKGLSIRVMVL